MENKDYFNRDKFVDLGDYDEQDVELLTLNDWISLYEVARRVKLNAGTMRKRRACSGLGKLVPPRVYLLTKAEFETVMATPLPMCQNVVR